jgi:hypothetical protein
MAHLKETIRWLTTLPSADQGQVLVNALTGEVKFYFTSPVRRLASSGGGGERGDFPSYVVRIHDVLFCRALVKELVGLERVL